MSRRCTHCENARYDRPIPTATPPEIVVSVLYEGGEHGYLAAPIAKAVINAYYDKKNGIQPHYTEKPQPGEAPVLEREIASLGAARP